jgi:hypothetical protein
MPTGVVDRRGRPLSVGDYVRILDFTDDAEGERMLGWTNAMLALIGSRQQVTGVVPFVANQMLVNLLNIDDDEFVWRPRWLDRISCLGDLVQRYRHTNAV